MAIPARPLLRLFPTPRQGDRWTCTLQHARSRGRPGPMTSLSIFLCAPRWTSPSTYRSIGRLAGGHEGSTTTASHAKPGHRLHSKTVSRMQTLFHRRPRPPNDGRHVEVEHRPGSSRSKASNPLHSPHPPLIPPLLARTPSESSSTSYLARPDRWHAATVALHVGAGVEAVASLHLLSLSMHAFLLCVRI
jgi:hypothetical protein